MDKLTERLENKSSQRNRFQIVSCAVLVFVYMQLDFLPNMLAYFTKMPNVIILNDSFQFEVTQLTFILCEQNPEVLTFPGYSIIYSLGEHCNKIKTALFSSFLFLGLLTAAKTAILLIDSIGRKKTIMLALSLNAVCQSLLLFPFNIYYIYFLMLFGGWTSGVSIITGYIYASENFINNFRSIGIGFLMLGCGLGGVVFILLAWMFDSSRLLFIVSATCSVVGIVLVSFLLIESPKFYLTKGNWRGFFFALRKIAKFNGTEKEFDAYIQYPNSLYELEDAPLFVETEVVEAVNQQTIAAVQQDCESMIDLHKIKGCEQMNANKSYSLLDILSFKSQRLQFLLASYCFFTVSCCLYGFLIFIKKIPGNMYVNGIFMLTGFSISYCFSSIPTNLKFLGRKYSSILYLTVAFTIYLLLQFGSFSEEVFIGLAVVGAMSSGASLTAIIIWFSEIYPLSIKTAAFSFNTVFNRIGGIITPFIVDLCEGYSSLVYGSICAFAIVGMCFIDETLGKTQLNVCPEEIESSDIGNLSGLKETSDDLLV